MDGHYRYTEDLLSLETSGLACQSGKWPRYYSPVRVDLLSPFLQSHPDQAYAAYIASGLRDGFCIGFRHNLARLRTRARNHPSCAAKRRVVCEKLAAELAAGRLLGPIEPHIQPSVHTSPMGLVPKPHQPDKFRLIVDLSTPTGRSVNDGISDSLCSLKYATIDDAVAKIQSLGRDTLLVKMDLKDAYRIIPVHPDDYYLLGVAWEGRTYLDRALPFGLCSAPKIFNAVADFICWVLHQHGIEHQLHYLDDFLFFGMPYSEEAARALDTASRVLRMLGIPIAVHKTEGPTTALVFLRIIVDTTLFELRLPADKLSRMKDLLRTWLTRSTCRKRELESLLGHLSHAAAVTRYGRTFLRQLFNLFHKAQEDHHFIHIRASARADLLWWHHFLQEWNGKSFFPQSTPSVQITSDASGSFGCGAFSQPHGWFQLQWPESWISVNIAAKELVPVVVAAAIWGPLWYQKCVQFRSDNMAVVEVLRSGSTRDPLLMHLIRCLVFYAVVYHFDFVTEHIPGVHNVAADSISRNNLALFFSLAPQIPLVSIPKPVRDLLVDVRPDWGSQQWITLFMSSLTKESPSQPKPCTLPVGEGMLSSAASLPTPHCPS